MHDGVHLRQRVVCTWHGVECSGVEWSRMEGSGEHTVSAGEIVCGIVAAAERFYMHN